MSEQNRVDPNPCPHCGAEEGFRYKRRSLLENGRLRPDIQPTWGSSGLGDGAVAGFFTVGPDMPDGDRRVCGMCGRNEAGYLATLGHVVDVFGKTYHTFYWYGERRLRTTVAGPPLEPQPTKPCQPKMKAPDPPPGPKSVWDLIRKPML